MNHDARAASNTRLREARSTIRHFIAADGNYYLGIPPVGATVHYADHEEIVVLSDWDLDRNTAAVGHALVPTDLAVIRTDIAAEVWRQTEPWRETSGETSDERYAAAAHGRRRESALRRALTWLDQDISPRTPIPRAVIPLAGIAIAILTLGILVTS